MYTREHFVFMLPNSCMCVGVPLTPIVLCSIWRQRESESTTSTNLNTTNSPEFVALYGSLFTFQILGVIFYYIFKNILIYLKYINL